MQLLKQCVTYCVFSCKNRVIDVMDVLLSASTSAAASEFDQDEPLGDNLQSLRYRISRVKQLQSDVDKLRELMSNKYAEEWGANLNCITQ